MKLTPAGIKKRLQAIRNSPSYIVAYKDLDFLNRESLRPVRLQLELLKPQKILHKMGIHATIVVFGSARILEKSVIQNRVKSLQALLKKTPRSKTLTAQLACAKALLSRSNFYEEARKFGRLASKMFASRGITIATGGGPGIMEAANRGAWEAGEQSLGLNITLPHEQDPNPYITPELCFQFHYFAIRKMHFMLRAKALVVFPGGYGTMDELFEVLTLIQTRKVPRFPVILFGKQYWQKAVNFQFLVDEGVIAPEDIKLFHFVETAEEAIEIIKKKLF